MLKEFRTVSFEGGRLRSLEGEGRAREAVLALPLSRLLVKMVHVPPGGNAAELALPLLKAASPFPDDALTVSCETVREDETGAVVIAAALPESAADDIGEALDAEKLSVVKIDALAIGQLRGLWPALNCEEGAATRRFVLIESADCISAFVLDGASVSSIRALDVSCDMRREAMLCLLEAEDFGGARELTETVIVRGEEAVPENAEAEKAREETMASFGPVRVVRIGADAGLVGTRERALDDGSLNCLPESWQQVLVETRFKAKLVKNLAIAGGVWLLAMGVLFGVPIVYGFLTDYQKGLSKQHAKQYREVKEMKDKTELVRKYSDHARGALEIMKAVSDRLPEGVELASWNFKRDEGVNVAGEATTAEAVYAFKDAMDAVSDEYKNEDGTVEKGDRIFPTVTLQGPSASKNGQRFSLDCSYAKEGEDE